MTAEKKKAFILLGGFRVIVRNWLYVEALHQRGLHILVITSDEWREDAQRVMAETKSIHDVKYVTGLVEIDGSYTPDVMTCLYEWKTAYDFVGVLAVGEMLVEPTGLVADAFNLPSPGLRATRVCRNKFLQRLYLSTLSPKVKIVPPSKRTQLDLSKLEFPLVLKPSSRRSSSGVHEIESCGEIDFSNYLDEETLLIEEYVIGTEFSIETLVQNSEVIFESITLKRTNEKNTSWFVELGHTIPAPLSSHKRDLLLSANRTIVNKLGFENSVVHSEVRLTKDERVVLMEVAARTPGDGILPLYHLATGRPMEPEILKIALNETAHYPQPQRFARQVYLDHPKGKLLNVSIDWPGIVPQWISEGMVWPDIIPGHKNDPAALRMLLVLKKRGTILTEIHNSNDRAISFLIDAPTQLELDKIEQEVRSAITLTVKNLSD